MADIDDDAFEAYQAPDIGPNDEYQSKAEHRYAIFILGWTMADAISGTEFYDADRLGTRMEMVDEVSDPEQLGIHVSDAGFDLLFPVGK